MRRQRRAAVGVFTIAAPHLLDEQSANHDLFWKCNGTFNWLLFSWICQNIFGGGNFLSVCSNWRPNGSKYQTWVVKKTDVRNIC